MNISLVSTCHLTAIVQVKLCTKNDNSLIMLTRESYVKHISLMLVHGNIGRVKKLAVVVGESGRGLGVVSLTLRNHNSPR
jgi:hypothetical protein